MKKVIIFVDANNWYHNVKKYYNPSDVDICKVSEFISKIFKFNIAGIRWYASMPSIKDGELIYKKHRAFLGSLEKRGVKIITRKLQRLSNKEILNKKQQTIDNLDLCELCKPLLEANFLDLIDIKKKEKGIDVWIAIDMIRKSILENKCDICILISGDADFVPALALIRDRGKEVLTSMVPLGYSTELRKKFPYFILKPETLKKCFREYKKLKNKEQ